LVAKKFDGSMFRKRAGRPKINHVLVSLIIQFSEENPSWGYDRIAGALSNLGYNVSDQTVGNILKRNGIPPVPNRTQETTWSKVIKNHQDVIAACDFFTTEVITPVRLITYYVLFFIHIGTRKITIAGITPHPNERWMKQIARNITMDSWGCLITKVNGEEIWIRTAAKPILSDGKIIKVVGIIMDITVQKKSYKKSSEKVSAAHSHQA